VRVLAFSCALRIARALFDDLAVSRALGAGACGLLVVQVGLELLPSLRLARRCGALVVEIASRRRLVAVQRGDFLLLDVLERSSSSAPWREDRQSTMVLHTGGRIAASFTSARLLAEEGPQQAFSGVNWVSPLGVTLPQDVADSRWPDG